MQKTLNRGIITGLCLVWSLCYVWGDGAAPSNASVAAVSLSTPDSIIKEADMKEQQSGTWTPGLSDAEKKTLFSIAKNTLDWCVNKQKGAFPIESYTLTPKLKAQTATFVTLKIKGELRGCIGSLAPVEPLYLSVHHNAINAALEDPRFQPVQPVELPRLEIDVSILSPIRDIASPDEFKLGRQGIILEKGMHRAVFLPEVAVEQGWTSEETLSYLSRKAGLTADAWKKDARFQVFESVVISMDAGKE